MKIKFNESKCAVSDAKKSYAEKKVAKLDRYFRREPEATVAFKSEKKNCRVELTVYADKACFRAEETAADMLVAIDATVSSIERQIHKHKTRLAKRIRENLNVTTLEEPEAEAEAEEETFEIARRKSIHLKPMSAEEAILEMNLLGHSFFAFRDADTSAFAVVYVRNDGGYGLIEDEA